MNAILRILFMISLLALTGCGDQHHHTKQAPAQSTVTATTATTSKAMQFDLSDQAGSLKALSCCQAGHDLAPNFSFKYVIDYRSANGCITYGDSRLCGNAVDQVQGISCHDFLNSKLRQIKLSAVYLDQHQHSLTRIKASASCLNGKHISALWPRSPQQRLAQDNHTIHLFS